MNLKEGLRRIGGKLFNVQIEPLGHAISRFHQDYNTAHEQYDQQLAQTIFVAEGEGSMPSEMQAELDRSRDRYRHMARLLGSGIRPRRVDIVLLTKHFSFERSTQLPLVRSIRH